YSSTCLKCTNLNDKTCEGVSETCKDNSKCFVKSDRSDFPGEHSSAIVKGCVDDTIICGYAGSLDIGGTNPATITTSIKCCDGDDCNSFGYD
ncbi:Hypothetical predicted protein, partial [Pelobates cultripes]